MSTASNRGSVRYDSRAYWLDRALDAEAKLQRAEDELDSANELIAQLERKREKEKDRQLLEDARRAGQPYWRLGVGR